MNCHPTQPKRFAVVLSRQVEEVALKLNYKHLHYFWVIAREGSLTSAGRILNLAPQTLSSQLSDLEASLGGLLFVRKKRQLELTDLGKVTYEHANEMFRIGESLKQRAMMITSKKRLSVSVGVSASIHKLLAYRLIQPAFSLGKEISIACETGTVEYLIAQLADYSLDVILSDRVPSIDQSQALHWYELDRSSISLFAACDLASQLKLNFPHSLDKQPFLAMSLDAPYLNQLLQWLENQNIQPVITGKIDDSALIKVFGAHGMGVFAAPAIIGDEVCRQYHVDCIGTIDAVSETLYAICRSRFSSNMAVQAICRKMT